MSLKGGVFKELENGREGEGEGLLCEKVLVLEEAKLGMEVEEKWDFLGCGGWGVLVLVK